MFPSWLSHLFFDMNPVWHLLCLCAAVFNEWYLESLIGRHVMTIFDHPAGVLVYAALGSILTFGKAVYVEKSWLSISSSTKNDVLCIGAWRTAQRVRIADPSSRKSAWIVNVHLSSGSNDDELRLRQMELILQWMVPVIHQADALVICGDMNANPHEAAYAFMVERGFTSCFKECHGTEPGCTFPGASSSFRAVSKDNGLAGVYDYVWIVGDISLAAGGDVKLFADTACKADTTLYPSDHFGVLADLELGSIADKAVAQTALVFATVGGAHGHKHQS